MKRQFLLTLWIVLIINWLIWLWIYLFNNNFTVLYYGWNQTSTWWIALNKKETVITQHITKTYNITNLQSKLIDTVKNVGNSVVSIVISKNLNVYYYSDPFSLKPFVEKKKRKIWWGSGIIVSKNGYILTNKHVVADLDADYSVVTKNGDIYKVDKIWTDPVLDLAVIHVINKDWTETYNLKPAKIINFDAKINVGEFVLAIWNPFAEYSNSVTFGILSAKWRKLENNNWSLYIWLYQTDTAINPWNSGWPLIDIDWQVIGVNTAISAQWWGIWFSIPINQKFVQATLKSIQKNWIIKRPLLWVWIIQLNKTIAKQYKLDRYNWVFVQKIIKNSPAFVWWIKKWDIILEVDGVKLSQDNPLIYTLFTNNIWDKVELLIDRKWKLFKKEITLFEF